MSVQDPCRASQTRPRGEDMDRKRHPLQPTAMHLMVYLDATGNRVYTLKVRRRPMRCPQRPRAA